MFTFVLRFSLLASAALLPFAASASEATTQAAVETAVESVFGVKPDSVIKTDRLGLYEVFVDGRIIYTDEKASSFFIGEMIDGKSREAVTGQQTSKMLYAKLPLELAIKQVRGNGKAKLVSFEDPNCGYCKKLARDLGSIKDTTIYTFLFPILSEDSVNKSRAIWCAKDRVKAWNDWMIDNKAPAAVADCKAPLQEMVALGQGFGISGTPTLIFADGSRAPGAIPLAQIEARLARQNAK